ncbi:hypothetical protein [Limnothrix sp. FACHB-881]|nr:hypothetical protein [Limnothrix sp. FACHB-881]
MPYSALSCLECRKYPISSMGRRGGQPKPIGGGVARRDRAGSPP